MKPAPYVFLAFFVLGCFSAYSQSDSSFLGRALGSLQRQQLAHPVEKVYLHLDRPAYSIGDTIWFKAYTVVGGQHQLSALSGVLYAELVNQQDSVVKRLTLPLMSGVAWGDFALPSSYKPGSYHVSAYTNYMRNAGPGYFYNQRVQVGGLQLSLATVKPAEAPNPDVQLFPEGGELVNGLRSRVAIKAVNANGLGKDIKGTIEDNDGNVVAGFATQHLGMGVFALTPQKGKTYKAKISGIGEAAYTVDLPVARDTGFTLAINNTDADSIYLKVAANDKLFKGKQNTPFYLVAQSGGKMYYTAAAKLENPVFTSKIEKSRFPSGIVQFTLFSQSGEPVAERIAFMQNNDTLKLKVSSPAAIYTSRQKVKIDLDAKDNNNNPIAGSFSVAVINESRVPADENAEGTILNNLLLTSDLKGYIEQPNYYFINPNERTRADLDVLMLTQGYRRFEWAQVLDTTARPITWQPETSLELEGTLKTPGGQPVPKGRVTLLATREKVIRDTTTDANGNFKFDHLYLTDTSVIVLRARKAHNGSNVAIYVKKGNYPAIIRQNQTDTALNLPPQIAAAMQKNYAQFQQQQNEDALKNAKQLKEVIVKGKKQAKPDIFNGYGTEEEHFIDMAKLQGYPSLENGIDATQPILFLPFKGNKSRMDKINVIIDGLPFHKSDLYAYDPKEIESVALIYGILPEDPPLIIVTTKRYAATDTTVLKEVTINGKKIQKQPELIHSANLNGPGNANQVIMGDKVEGCVNLSDCLNGKVFGVTFKNGVPFSNRAQGRMSGPLGMVVIVDGIIMGGSHLNDLNANDIYSIEVLRSGSYLAIYGSDAPGGALVITTKRGGEPGYVTSEAPSGLITYPFKGFYKAREFYSPRYDHPKANSRTGDFRTTIFWKPDILTDKDGKASFDYFNADTKGIYRVVVEGIDDNGNLGRQVYRYKVE